MCVCVCVCGTLHYPMLQDWSLNIECRIAQYPGQSIGNFESFSFNNERYLYECFKFVIKVKESLNVLKYADWEFYFNSTRYHNWVEHSTLRIVINNDPKF